jgi:hypothetical protein
LAAPTGGSHLRGPGFSLGSRSDVDNGEATELLLLISGGATRNLARWANGRGSLRVKATTGDPNSRLLGGTDHCVRGIADRSEILLRNVVHGAVIKGDEETRHV